MHSSRFGEYPVIWQHMPNLTGLTTDERGPASQGTAHLHKKHSFSMKSLKIKKGNLFLTCLGALSMEKDTKKQEKASESRQSGDLSDPWRYGRGISAASFS